MKHKRVCQLTHEQACRNFQRKSSHNTRKCGKMSGISSPVWLSHIFFSKIVMQKLLYLFQLMTSLHLLSILSLLFFVLFNFFFSFLRIVYFFFLVLCFKWSYFSMIVLFFKWSCGERERERNVCSWLERKKNEKRQKKNLKERETNKKFMYW